MPSASSAAAAAPKPDDRRRQILEQGTVKFQIKTGNARYICRVMDRPTLERTRSSASSSASSVATSSPVESGANSFVSSK
ncbi:hypothetical protein B0T18DRAFT_429566 [Schizothecium vesticola]|uniref:Uncharacterized protein n=1 Tax=Schizothecium vesticola TaxID=314040 RepID=A0AA40K5F6_9PEZI|nr:hypothetical protein B0T18DRAFT_429566 [Schizothecium vesticola]